MRPAAHRRRVRPLRGGLAWGLGVAAAGLTLPVTVAAPAYAVGDSCDAISTPDTQPVDRPDASAPVAALRIDEAHDLVRAAGSGPGAGVVVAIVDGGIAPGVLPRVVAGPRISSGVGPPEWPGTAVAGLIAGPPDGDRTIGIAPEATLVDVRVYDSLTPDDGEDGLSPDAVAAGLQALADQQAGLRTDIVVVPRAVSRSDALDDAVDALAERDVIVVAASGDRPDDESDPLYAQYGPGAARRRLPAGPSRTVRRGPASRRGPAAPRTGPAPARTPRATPGRPATTSPPWSPRPPPRPRASTPPARCSRAPRSTSPPRPPAR